MVALSHLRSFHALELAMRTGSLKAAAGVLGITPAAVGQRVKALEDYLGVELFVRGRAGLIPTPSLTEALPHLTQAFSELERCAALLDLQRGQELHIAAEADFADLWLKPRLASFRAAYPNILVVINGEGEARFRPAPADCEIAFGPPAPGADLLFADYVAPISSPENTARIARIAERDRLEGFPLLHLDFYRNDPAAPNWPRWIAGRPLARTDPDRGMRFQRIVPAIEAVLADAGLVICGLALLADRIDDGRLSLPFPIGTGVWTKHAFHARIRGEGRPHVRRFRDWLLAESQATEAWLDATVASR